ncbi:putative adhesin [Streptomyces bohaiensis]|uniref:RHS repeat protein n=1 Tax=Streptomyces bohaiensis TaxID=1431344 RepID=A0ABX1CA87_9ACTN|nr:RHS repeat-associated core domain-containing protein [Streptomyces bohaiensis]NJQ16049.1 hypothetical protein [Streptomyces bohaiensis]
MHYDEHGRVTFIGDRGGNGLSITHQDGRPAVITDDVGREHRLAYDGGRLATVTLADGRTLAYTFAGGLLAEVTGLDGSTTGYAHDDDGRLASVTGPDGGTRLELTYDSSGRVSSQRDAAGAVTRFSYERDAGIDYAHATSPGGGVWTDVYGGNVLLAEIDPFGNITSHTYDSDRNRTAIEDPLGNRTIYRYDSRGRVTSESSGSTSTTWRYSANGLVSEITDGAFRKTFLSYTDEGWLSEITDELNATTALTYTDDGYLQTVTSPEGRTVTYAYDDWGNRTTTVLPEGDVEKRRYDSSGRLLTVVDPRGAEADEAEGYTTSFTYDNADRIISRTLPDGGTERYTYNANGHLASFADAAANVTEYSYDAAGRLAEISETGGRVTRYGYDTAGNVQQVTGPDGAKTAFAYDEADRPISRTTPRGGADGANPEAFTWKFGYDKAGRPVTVTDPLGGTTERAFDNDGRITGVTNPLGRTRHVFYDGSGKLQTLNHWAGGSTRYTYDKAGRPTRVSDPRNKNYHFSYDADGNLTEQRSPAGAVTTYEYDGNGQRVAMTDPRGNAQGADPDDFTWRYAYDDAGLLIEITNPLGHTQSTAYDGNGRATALTDALGNTTEYRYDTTGRLAGITAPDGGITAYAYSAAGDLATRSDANGNVTDYGYDQAGRLTSVTDPLERVRELDYDLDGNLTGETNSRGQTSSYEIDALGRVTTVSYSDSTPSVSIDYDAIGRITEVTDGTGTRNFPGLDWLGRPTLLDLPDGQGRLAYNYDYDGNVTRFTTESNIATAYGYDDDSRMISASTRNRTTAYERDPSGNITSITSPTPNRHIENRVYDAAGQLSAVRNTGPDGELSSWEITRDANGQPLIVDVVRAGETHRRLFAYDVNGRLTQECTVAPDNDSCPSGAATTDYTYDLVGNRLTQQTGTSVVENLFDEADQLTRSTTGSAATDYAYDADGNLVSAGEDTFGYNAAGRLSWAQTPEGRTSYGYDADGNRTSASLDGQLLRTSVWDIVRPLPQLTADYDGSGRLISAYAYGAEDRIQSGHRSSASAGFEQYHHDWMGSVADLTDQAGTPQHRYEYTAFGVTEATQLDADAQANPFTFTGQYTEPTTDAVGLNLRARNYHPDVGRFTSPDPAPRSATDPYTSSYAYAENLPTTLTDPSGRCPICVSVGIGAVLGAVVEGGIYAFTTDDFGWAGLAQAAGKGAVVGGLGGALMPGAGNVAARSLGLTGARGLGASAGVNAAVGAGYAWSVNTVQCRPTSPTDLLLGGLGGAASSLAGPAAEWAKGLRGPSRGTTPTYGPGVGSELADSVTLTGRTDQSSVITGHGVYIRGSGDFTVPPGTFIKFYVPDGKRLSDAKGFAVETGTRIRPTETFGPGKTVPNYTVLPPNNLRISSRSISVTQPTQIGDIVRPNMGACHAAICREHLNPGDLRR